MNIKIIDLDKTSPYLENVKTLHKMLYEYMKSCGMLMPLTEDGSDIWLNSIKSMIGGKFGSLKVALSNDMVIGFVHGVIRFAPAYLGGKRVGYITHIFVLPSYQKFGAGKLLLTNIEEWFKSNSVNSFEINVICRNINGINFWKNMGYLDELLQMRKITTSKNGDK